MNIITAEQLINELTDEQLEQACQELESWWSTGVLGEDTIIRGIYNKMSNPTYAITLIATPLLHEIVRRYRKVFEAITHAYDYDEGTDLMVARKMAKLARHRKLVD